MQEDDRDDLFIDNRKNSESAFWRLKRAADARREARVRSILAQEGERLSITLGRAIYISFCILFNFLILAEIIFLFDEYLLGIFAFGIALGFAVIFQKNLYDNIFAIDMK
ncbi:MAG: hypothetical protein CND29_04055 [Marine Group II euryarchaeote MED-G36]|nr:MAG: hypothetical protein CND29_04055 [Marine Group II euryarchaeote MED-G36]